MQLSVIDQSPIREGGTASEAIHESVKLAQATEELGYKRYWVAEHHASQGLACSAPEILISAIAGSTQSIRVGSGGVMLLHYSPMKVAEQFQTLEILYQNRIDLGLGRAIGGHQKVASRLSFDRELIPLDAYEAMICELLGYFNEKKLYSDPANGMLVQPILETFPAIWILGSSDESAFIAAKYGLPFCFAEFLNPLSGEKILEIYRNNFQDSASNTEPQATVALSALCADSQSLAENIAWSRYCWQFRRGKIPSIEEARKFQYSDAEIDYVNYLKTVDVLGSVRDVGQQLRSRAERYAVDEFFLLTTTYDFSDRLRSYELIAEEFQLLGVSR